MHNFYAKHPFNNLKYDNEHDNFKIYLSFHNLGDTVPPVLITKLATSKGQKQV